MIFFINAPFLEAASKGRVNIDVRRRLRLDDAAVNFHYFTKICAYIFGEVSFL